VLLSFGMHCVLQYVNAPFLLEIRAFAEHLLLKVAGVFIILHSALASVDRHIKDRAA
jgi:hypothetical protein